MPRRDIEEVWDRDLMKQQLGEMREESVRLKRELTRAKKVQEKGWRETSELRRLVQDGRLRGLRATRRPRGGPPFGRRP
jgi:hypothetical protein